MKKLVTGTQIVFPECSGSVFKKIMDMKKLYVGRQSFPVNEDLTIQICKNCFGFEHKGSVCTNKLACSYCGGEHKIANCKIEIKQCVNCISSVSKHKLNIDIHHEVSNRDCSTLKFHTKRLISSTD